MASVYPENFQIAHLGIISGGILAALIGGVAGVFVLSVFFNL
jgi:hypothetical protein